MIVMIVMIAIATPAVLPYTSPAQSQAVLVVLVKLVLLMMMLLTMQIKIWDLCQENMILTTTTATTKATTSTTTAATKTYGRIISSFELTIHGAFSKF